MTQAIITRQPTPDEPPTTVGRVVATGAGVKWVGPPGEFIEQYIARGLVVDPATGGAVDPVREPDRWVRNLPDSYRVHGEWATLAT